jgi:hypothetical protein
MEYWSDGVLGKSGIISNFYSFIPNIPQFKFSHYSNASLQYSNTPVLRGQLTSSFDKE